jgi:small nuclear ribonucleoprotein (snRNP)-like protein
VLISLNELDEQKLLLELKESLELDAPWVSFDIHFNVVS